MPSPQERFTALFDATRLALLAYALRRVDDPADAADVVAETYLIAWRRLDDVPPGDRARPWLFAVARNVLSNHHRGERRRTALADRLRTAVVSVSPVERPEATAVGDAMRTLSTDDQELLRLAAWEDLDHAQIAIALGLASGTVRVRLHRARQRLRRALDADAVTSIPAMQAHSYRLGSKEIQ